MNDNKYLKKARKRMITITFIWAIVIGLPLFLIPWLKYGSLFWGLFFGIGWGIFPLVLSTAVNWNNTHTYS